MLFSFAHLETTQRGGALITAICLRHCIAEVVDPVYGIPTQSP